MVLLFRAWIMCFSLLVVSARAQAPIEYGAGCTDCSAGMPYPCAHTLSKKLTEAAYNYLSTTDDEESVAWGKITNDAVYKIAGGFYVFAYDYNGPCVAHGARSDFVGNTLPEIVAMVNNPTNGTMVDDALQAGAEGGGGWTLYDWTNAGDAAPYKKVAYTQKLSKWGNEYYLGVGFNQLPDALDEACTPASATACAEKNSLNIMGDLLASLYTASAEEMNSIFMSITNKEAYRTETGFYPFIYQFAGPCVAHGANPAFVGKTLPEIVAFINNPSDGTVIDEALQAGAEAGGSWVEYMWKNNAEEDTYAKTAYSMKFTVDGVDYYAGVGYNNVCSEDYKAMASCKNSPNAPRTGPGGVGVCIPKTGVMNMKCGDVKSLYKAHECCGAPTKDVDFSDSYRRLAGR